MTGRPRYKVGDKLYSVSAHGAEDCGDGMEPAEVSLSTYIVRTIRRSNTKALHYRSSVIKPLMVTAYPSEWVKESKNGLVFDKACPRWWIKCWRFDDKPNNLHRTKSAAYRAELADLRSIQRKDHKWDESLTPEEFNMLVGRLKSAITRNTKS